MQKMQLFSLGMTNPPPPQISPQPTATAPKPLEHVTSLVDVHQLVQDDVALVAQPLEGKL